MTEDPIFAASERHRVAYAALCALPYDSPDDDHVADGCVDVEHTMLATVLTTPAGLRALVEYAAERLPGYDGIPFQNFPAILAPCRAVLPAGPDRKPRTNLQRSVHKKEKPHMGA